MRADRSSGPIAGIVLAAGVSSRMGRNKMFIEVGGETLLHRAVRVARDGRLSPVIVVLGHEADRAGALLAGLPCLPIVNEHFLDGIQSSVRAGVGAVPDSACAAVVVLADMPLVTSEMIAALINRYRDGTAPLVLSSYDGVNAPPTLYDRSLFPELARLEGHGCGKQVVQRHREEAAAVDWPSEVLTDLDEPDDVERVAMLLGGHGAI